MTVTADVVPQEKFGLVSGIVGGTAVAAALPIQQAYWVVGATGMMTIATGNAAATLLGLSWGVFGALLVLPVTSSKKWLERRLLFVLF